ncbi:uncharacterized protein LOC129280709 [Lytechinus pictus]|uniref:uncharacterized protein LOC129280709 n=1 Tax=Lytechinus pictus TaxID=7653 RepID=UPI0030B9E493
MAQSVKALCVCLCIVAFFAMGVKAQTTMTTDRTAQFKALCDIYRLVVDTCEEDLRGLLTSTEQNLIDEAENDMVCLLEEGEQNSADACEILEKICLEVVDCSSTARFRRSSSVSAESSSVESSMSSETD